jgi:hypothetical protein
MKETVRESQVKLILAWMKSGKSITQMQALNLFGCMRLGARIFDISALGYEVKREFEHKNKKKWMKYWLEK